MAQVDRDLVFAAGGGAELALDVYRAPRDDAPVTLCVHGGGWRAGDKADDGPRRLAPLSPHGVTVVSVNYRLAPAATFPSQLHDGKAAVRWRRANGARLGLPTERLGVWGASAGAYLGSLLALTAGVEQFEGTVGGNLDQSSAVQAVVHWFGQSDLVASASRTEVEARLLPFAFAVGLLGVADVAGAADRARELGLLSWVTPGAPPFLIAHGDRDHVILPSEGEALHRPRERWRRQPVRTARRHRARGRGVRQSRLTGHDRRVAPHRASRLASTVMRQTCATHSAVTLAPIRPQRSSGLPACHATRALQ